MVLMLFGLLLKGLCLPILFMLRQSVCLLQRYNISFICVYGMWNICPEACKIGDVASFYLVKSASRNELFCLRCIVTAYFMNDSCQPVLFY